MPFRRPPVRLAAGIAALVMLGAIAAPVRADAQSVAQRVLCTNHGPNLIEPIAEREGQSLLAAEATCVVQGGPMDGAVETQHNLWHYDKGTGTLLSGQAVGRKPGALSAATVSQGTLNFQMTEGRVTGWTASGRGRMLLAAGAATPLAGKSFSWTASPTGPRAYVVQVNFEP